MTERHAELETAQNYAAGRLDPASSTTFEEHLLTCAQCQTEVRLTTAVRRVIREEPARLGQRTLWISAAATVLAAGLAIFLVSNVRGNVNVTALGHVQDPPMYIGMSVRALPRRGDSLFASAMTAYSARDYDAAARGLRAALAAGADTVPTEFFIASAELMADHPSAAVAGYERVIGAGARAAAYAPEAHLYRARALLRLGSPVAALADLAEVGTDDAGVAARAAALSDSVRRVIRR